MSHTETSPTTLNDIKKSESTEDCKGHSSDKHSKSVSNESSSPDRTMRDHVLKLVGFTSTAFIGPAFPPETTPVKSDIEESLSEFYKELENIQTTDGANGNPGKQDAGFCEPLRTQDVPEKKKDTTRNSPETDSNQKNSGRKQSSWPHWYHNEPYYPRRQCPGPDMSSGMAVSTQNQWHHPQPQNTLPFPHQPASSAFPNPQNPPPHVNPIQGSSGMTNQYQEELHISEFSRFPSRDLCTHPSQGFYGDSPHHFDRDHQDCSYNSHLDNATVRWCRDGKEEWSQFKEGYDRPQRFDSLDDVWERHHYYQPRDDARANYSALVLILMRGLPGSGKSTRARELLSTGPSGVILSTDDYFAHQNGYHYEPGLLGAAHEWNQHRAKDALHDGRTPIIIDNTNLQAWEMKPYVKMALERGYDVHFCEPDTSWKFDPYELERRNKHGVPHEKIAQMMDRFSFPISVDVVMSSQEPPHVSQRRRPEQPQMSRKKQDFH